jgi:mono/diheme cytochrome c family protein
MRNRLTRCTRFSLVCTVIIFFGTPPLVAQTGNIGKEIYEQRCAMCHGKEGKGDGLPAPLLDPKPRDLTAATYKIRSTESGTLPTDDDIVKTIKSGLHGTSMPGWGWFMGDDSIRAVVQFIKTFSPRFRTEKPKPVAVGAAVTPSSSSIATGKKVYERLQCAKCHGTDGRGSGAVQDEFTDIWGNSLVATNLTEPWAFRGGSTARDAYLRFRTGLDGTPMPSYKGTATDAEMWHLANYVLSLARKPAWQMSEKELRSYYDGLAREAKANPIRRGKYLVGMLGCASCHSMYREDGSMVSGGVLAGGLTFELYPYGKYVTTNLTSDKETGLGAWTDDEIKNVLTRGIRRDGSKMLPFPMPWTTYAHLTDDDLNAVVAYLRTVPPVKNKIPPPEKLTIVSYLWGKFRVLILKEQIPSLLYPMKTSELN